MVSITNSVIFLFKLELKQFNISKILPMWKIGVLIIVMFTIICYFLAFFEKFEDIEIIVFF